MLEKVGQLQAAARAGGIPLLHFAYVVDLDNGSRPFHPLMPDGTSYFSDKNDPLTDVCPEVAPRGGEPLIVKAEATGFGAASPEQVLRGRDVEWLVIAGVWSEACVDATVKDALHVAQRMVAHVERNRRSLQQQSLSISFGVVQVQPDENLTDAIRRASQALDEARSQGDSRFVSAEDDDGLPVFSPSQTLGHSGF